MSDAERVYGFPPVGRTRRELREMIARAFGAWKGTAQSGTTTTIVDSRLAKFADDTWIGAQAWLEKSKGASWVTDFVSSTGTLTVAPNLEEAPNDGDVYWLYTTVSKDDIDSALNEVCYGEQAALELTADTNHALIYGLTDWRLLRPEQVLRVLAVYDDYTPPRTLHNWSIEADAGVLRLRLERPVSAQEKIYVVYRVAENGLESDDTRVQSPALLIRARAIVYLLENLLANQDQPGLDKIGTLLRYWVEQRDKLEKDWQPPSREAQTTWVGQRMSEPLWSYYGLEDKFA